MTSQNDYIINQLKVLLAKYKKIKLLLENWNDSRYVNTYNE